MAHFLLKLLPPRPSFPHDMNPPEAEAMRAHVGYWTKLVDEGSAVVVGPVADPTGFWGLAVVEAADLDIAAALTAADPVIAAELGFRYETYAMPQVIARSNRSGDENGHHD